MFGFDVKDRGKDIKGAEAKAEANRGATEPLWDGGWRERRERAARFLASVDASLAARRRRRNSGVMW
ncbi:MAG: hypothetical protein KA712_18710 [Myxococcales bacterium]|nr:hypothetical protein [Myxococcales bacterium]